ncbi:MAG TPA: M28 family peptidase [Gemmataceae bacterium]|nr:M28 family peptidase [Gemmataceae bacterium]
MLNRAFLSFLLIAPVLHGDDSQTRMKADLFFLAGEECEGRGLKTDGINKAADYIAAAFRAAGLKPAAGDSYFQPFAIKETYLEAGPHVLAFAGPDGQKVEGEFRKTFSVTGLSGRGTVGGDVVFAGYGIAIEKKYDDFAGLDVKNKVVVVFRRTPHAAEKTNPFLTAEEVNQHASLSAKISAAAKRGAAAVVFVNDRDLAGKDDPLVDFDYAKDDGKTGNLPVLHVKRAVVDQMLAPTGKTLAGLEAGIDKDHKPLGFAVPGWAATVETAIGVRDIPAKNVVGYLEGHGPLANETVVLGAHYDHLGRGEKGTKELGSSAIHYGADDNASGTTALLDLARRYGAKQNREGRRLVFIAFSGEERGLFGSIHYCDKPLFPIADTVAMLNMDMVGRVRPDDKTKKDRIVVGGVGSAKNFEKLLDDTNAKFDFQIDKSKSGTGPSDHTSFYMAKVPVYFFFSREHPEYHTPKDRPETINLAGVGKVTDMVEQIATAIATAKDRPEYVPGMHGSPSGGPTGPKLGLMPSYNEGSDGMEVSGIVPGGAAEAAGLKKGDVIKAIDGKPVKNVQDYMKVMAGTKRGEPVEIKIERDGKPLTVKASPR